MGEERIARGRGGEASPETVVTLRVLFVETREPSRALNRFELTVCIMSDADLSFSRDAPCTAADGTVPESLLTRTDISLNIRLFTYSRQTKFLVQKEGERKEK